MTEVRSLDAKCGENFRFRDFVECGETFNALRPNNVPRSEKTYDALERLAHEVLDPVIKAFGPIRLTYGLACGPLSRRIKSRISPPHDQHASYEENTHGKQICARGGAAVDFLCPNRGSLEVAQWISGNCKFDRLYFYGDQRSVHVSVGPDESGKVVLMLASKHPNRLIPRKISITDFCNLRTDDNLIGKCGYAEGAN